MWSGSELGQGIQQTTYGSTMTEEVCQELGQLSGGVGSMNISIDSTSVKTIEVYKDSLCEGVAFVAGFQDGDDEVKVSYDDIGGGIWDNQIVAVKIAPSLSV